MSSEHFRRGQEDAPTDSQKHAQGHTVLTSGLPLAQVAQSKACSRPHETAVPNVCSGGTAPRQRVPAGAMPRGRACKVPPAHQHVLTGGARRQEVSVGSDDLCQPEHGAWKTVEKRAEPPFPPETEHTPKTTRKVPVTWLCRGHTVRHQSGSHQRKRRRLSAPGGSVSLSQEDLSGDLRKKHRVGLERVQRPRTGTRGLYCFCRGRGRGPRSCGHFRARIQTQVCLLLCVGPWLQA